MENQDNYGGFYHAASEINRAQMRRTAAKRILSVVTATCGVLLTAGLAGCPSYKVYMAEMSGKAEFSRAEQNRRIMIEEAKANLEAEKLNAQAEIERAKGAAEAIKIENGSITPTYIQYLWVRQQGMQGNKTLIYVPTETGLPVMEAGRMTNSEE